MCKMFGSCSGLQGLWEWFCIAMEKFSSLAVVSGGKKVQHLGTDSSFVTWTSFEEL
jgi:hypothetical protein